MIDNIKSKEIKERLTITSTQRVFDCEDLRKHIFSFLSMKYKIIIGECNGLQITPKNYIKLWGTGFPRREVIYVDDLADAVIYFMNKRVSHSLINIGTSKDRSIREFAKLILKILNIKLKVKFDNEKKLDGVKRKVLDTSLARKYGWKPKINLEDAVIKTFNDLRKNFSKIR